MNEMYISMEVKSDEKMTKYSAVTFKKNASYEGNTSVLTADNKFKEIAEKYIGVTSEFLDKQTYYSMATTGARSNMLALLNQTKEIFKEEIENKCQFYPFTGYIILGNVTYAEIAKSHRDGHAIDAMCYSTCDGYDTSLNTRFTENKRILMKLRQSAAPYSILVCQGTEDELTNCYIHISDIPYNGNPNNKRICNIIYTNSEHTAGNITFSDDCAIAGYGNSSGGSSTNKLLNDWLGACETVMNFYVKNITTCGSNKRYSGSAQLGGGIYDTNAGFIMASLFTAEYITLYDDLYRFPSFYACFAQTTTNEQSYLLTYDYYYRNLYEMNRWFELQELCSDPDEIEPGDIVITKDKVYVAGKNKMADCYEWNSVHTEVTSNVTLGEDEEIHIMKFRGQRVNSDAGILYGMGNDDMEVNLSLSDSAVNSKLSKFTGSEVLQRIDKVFSVLKSDISSMSDPGMCTMLKMLLVSENGYSDGVSDSGKYMTDGFANTDGSNVFKYTQGTPASNGGWMPLNVMTVYVKSLISNGKIDKIIDKVKTLHEDADIIEENRSKIKEILDAGANEFKTEYYSTISKELLFDIIVGCAMCNLSEAVSNYKSSNFINTYWLNRPLDDFLLKVMSYNCGVAGLERGLKDTLRYSETETVMIKDCNDIIYVDSCVPTETKNYVIKIMALLTDCGVVPEFPYQTYQGVYRGAGEGTSFAVLIKLGYNITYGGTYLDD